MAWKGKGRQKLEMVKMSNESSLQVTFSKRRSGLFKKASELCTLCGVEVAIIVFSPSNKVYSFGHPCVESVMNHFITRNPPQISDTMHLFRAHYNANIYELNMQLTQVVNELEIEKKRGDDLIQLTNASQSQHWWRAPIDDLSPHQLANLKVGLEGLKKQVMQQAQKLMMEASAPPQYFSGSSSTGRINQLDPTNTNSNFSSENIMPPPPPLPMIQSSAHPQDFSNDIGFNPPTMDMVPPPHMIQSSAPSQYFPGSSSTGGILQFNPTNTNSNLSNENLMPPPPLPMIQSFAYPQDFSNNIGFNPSTMNMVPPHMIQSSTPSDQYYPGSSSNGGNIPFDPNNIAFNPLNTNMHDASSSSSLA